MDEFRYIQKYLFGEIFFCPDKVDIEKKVSEEICGYISLPLVLPNWLEMEFA